MYIKNQEYNSKRKILEELFDFYEDEMYSDNEENREYINKIIEIEKPFYEDLTDAQKEQFEKLMDLKGLNEGVTSRKIFTFAFSLAIKIILESK